MSKKLSNREIDATENFGYEVDGFLTMDMDECVGSVEQAIRNAAALNKRQQKVKTIALTKKQQKKMAAAQRNLEKALSALLLAEDALADVCDGINDAVQLGEAGEPISF